MAAGFITGLNTSQDESQTEHSNKIFPLHCVSYASRKLPSFWTFTTDITPNAIALVFLELTSPHDRLKPCDI